MKAITFYLSILIAVNTNTFAAEKDKEPTSEQKNTSVKTSKLVKEPKPNILYGEKTFELFLAKKGVFVFLYSKTNLAGVVEYSQVFDKGNLAEISSIKLVLHESKVIEEKSRVENRIQYTTPFSIRVQQNRLKWYKYGGDTILISPSKFRPLPCTSSVRVSETGVIEYQYPISANEEQICFCEVVTADNMDLIKNHLKEKSKDAYDSLVERLEK